MCVCVCVCVCVCACVYMCILSLSLFIYPLLRFSFAYKHLSELHICNSFTNHNDKCEHNTYSTLVVTGIRGRGAERPVYIDLGRDSFPVFLVDLINKMYQK